eukprot:SAG22_NODE_79_length_21845_cov_17.798538_13_plen_799_part_00
MPPSGSSAAGGDPALEVARAIEAGDNERVAGHAAAALGALRGVEAEQHQLLLHSIFDFSHMPRCSEQNAGHAQSLAKLVLRYLREHHGAADPDAAARRLFEDDELLGSSEALRAAHRSIEQALAGNAVSWHPQYGCAILAAQAEETHGCFGEPMIHIHVIGLDDWRFGVHVRDVRVDPPPHDEQRSVYQHTAFSHGHSSTYCGAVPVDQHSEFRSRFSDVLSKASQRKGGARSAADGSQGHQKTPSFIGCLVQQTIENLHNPKTDDDKKGVAPRGGFTDVGLHTGGDARGVSWPLVRAVVGVVVQQGVAADLCASPRQFFGLTVAHFQLWLTEQKLSTLQHDSDFDAKQVNVLMTMLGATVASGVDMLNNGHVADLKVFELRCTAARQTLDTRNAARAKVAAIKFQLPQELASFQAVDQSQDQHLLPVRVPPVFRPSQESMEECEIVARAVKNLGWLPLLGDHQQPTSKFARLVEWLDHSSLQLENCDSFVSQLVMRTVERTLFDKAKDLEAEPLEESEVIALEKTVDIYRRHWHNFMQTKEAAARMAVELRSREVLVIWVAFCLIFAAARCRYTVLKEYGVGLRWEDLRHLVLGDKIAQDTALSVCNFLHKNTRDSAAVFTLRDEAPTFQMAEEYGREFLISKWNVEQKRAEQRRSKHWDVVQLKQEEAKGLRKVIDRLEQELRRQEAHLSSRQVAYNLARWSSGRNQHERECDSAQQTVNSTCRELSEQRSKLSAAENYRETKASCSRCHPTNRWPCRCSFSITCRPFSERCRGCRSAGSRFCCHVCSRTVTKAMN